MRALVSGAAGFAGRYLINLLSKKGYSICAIDIHFSSDHLSDANTVKKIVDIRQPQALHNLFKEFVPDEIYHLAGIAAITGQDRGSYYQVNFQGTLNLFEAVQKYVPKVRVLYVSSSNVYGVVPPDFQPINEDRFFAPINHYAASKAAADAAAYTYALEGMQIIRARPFNHTGPGQTTNFVCSRLAKRIAQLSKYTEDPVIDAGNLDVARDFSDVRDVVRAYWLLLQQGCPGEAYNVCSEKAYTIREIASILAGLGQVEIELRSQPELQRKTDIPLLLGSAEKIRCRTGWSPEVPLHQTLADLLLWWQEKIKRQ